MFIIMVLVSHTRKFIYIKNLKVAGTSVEAFFEKYCVKPQIGYITEDATKKKESAYGIVGDRTGYPGTELWYDHMPASEIKNLLGDNIFNQYTKFCVVRNPYDKMVSLFHFFGGKVDGNLKENFKKYCIQNSSSDLNRITIDGKFICDIFIRYENLENDLVIVCNKLGLNECNIKDLPKFKSSSRDRSISSYREYYDEETKKIVYDKHKEEFEYFGYQF